MFIRLLFALTIIPFIELIILLKLADAFSWQATLALVVATGIVGATLARREGLKALVNMREAAGKGAVPAQAILDAALIVAAGLVLITPGILTDICGFALLLPPVRRALGRRLADWFKRNAVIMQVGPHGHVSDPGADFVDVDPVGHDNDHDNARLSHSNHQNGKA